MLKFSVQFFTNNLPKGTNKKTAWSSGAVHILSDSVKGIKHDHEFFDLAKGDFLKKFEKLAKKHGVEFITQSQAYTTVKMTEV